MKTAAVILAAGSSRRFGQPKPLLQWQGETLLHRACRIAHESNHHPILVVAAPHANLPLPDYAQSLPNPNHHLGMGTSLALAAQQLTNQDTQSITVLFPDQPAITTENLRSLHSTLSPEKTIVLSHSGEHSGPPALFARKHFTALCQLTGDQGAKQLTEEYSTETAILPIPEAIWDIDTPAIWEDFKKSND
ncbi:MAG: nucleotidyltransferase family protein [Roseibacillus sp.]